MHQQIRNPYEIEAHSRERVIPAFQDLELYLWFENKFLLVTKLHTIKVTTYGSLSFIDLQQKVCCLMVSREISLKYSPTGRVILLIWLYHLIFNIKFSVRTRKYFIFTSLLLQRNNCVYLPSRSLKTRIKARQITILQYLTFIWEEQDHQNLLRPIVYYAMNNILI